MDIQCGSRRFHGACGGLSVRLGSIARLRRSPALSPVAAGDGFWDLPALAIPVGFGS